MWSYKHMTIAVCALNPSELPHAYDAQKCCLSRELTNLWAKSVESLTFFPRISSLQQFVTKNASKWLFIVI